MASIERRHGVYRVKVRIKNIPTQTATFHSLKLAKQWAQSTEAAIREQRYFPGTSARHTLHEAIERYCATILIHKSEGHQYNQNQQLAWWITHLGNVRLTDITPDLVAEHRDILSRGRSGSTVNRYLAALSAVMTAAVKDWRWLDQNPLSKVRKPPKGRARVRFLSDDERERLLQACRESDSSGLYLLVVLALATGARRGELLSLTWPRVDLKRGTIFLEHTKNGERRTLPLVGYALDLMRQQERTDAGLVFPGPRTGEPLCIRSAWETAVKRAHIEDFRFHDLRHSAASYLAMNGASLAEIGEILGHKSLEVTRRYAHLSEGHTRKVVAAMNAKLFGEQM